MMPSSYTSRERGTTLVELVIAITVIAMAVTAVLGLLSSISVRSASAMTGNQSASIASAYLDEVLSKAYVDPDGIAEVGRQNFDNVADYNGLNDIGARDYANNPIAGLTQYNVSVTVAAPAALGVAPNTTNARRVTVVVTGPTGATTRLQGYRTSYAGQVLH